MPLQRQLKNSVGLSKCLPSRVSHSHLTRSINTALEAQTDTGWHCRACRMSSQDNQLYGSPGKGTRAPGFAPGRRPPPEHQSPDRGAPQRPLPPPRMCWRAGRLERCPRRWSSASCWEQDQQAPAQHRQYSAVTGRPQSRAEQRQDKAVHDMLPVSHWQWKAWCDDDDPQPSHIGISSRVPR